MNISEKFLAMGEYLAAGLYEESERSLFYRKALGLRRILENDSMLEYHNELLYPSGELKSELLVKKYYYRGMVVDYTALSAKDQELAEKLQEDFFKYTPSVPAEHCVAGMMYIHSMPNYERILKEGLNGYSRRAEQIEDADMREGLLHVIAGIKAYSERCVDYLESQGAEEKLIAALRKVPFEPAETLYEAIVCWNFILYLDDCDNLGCLASGLMPYYRGENVVPLLRNLYQNLDVNNGYSMALGIDYSPLTLQCLEAAKGMRRPMIELFVHKDTPEEIWNAAFKLVKTGGGQPAFYNHDVIMNGLKERFPQIRQEDLKKFCGGGCTESMLAGLSNVGSLDAGINLALILEKVICEKLETAEGFEAFYGFFMEEAKAVVDKVTTEIANSQRERAKYDPLPMRTLLIDDCIEKGLDYNNGGARYMWSIVNFAGMINVIDSMLVIRDLLYRERRFTASEMVELMKESNEEFLKMAGEHSICFGNDNPEADELAHRLSSDIYALLDEPKPYLGYGFLPASIQFMTAAMAGEHVGATPDGRKAGEPLCESLGAIGGKDRKGPTALLKSVTSLDLKRALGIPVLNFTIHPGFDKQVMKGLVLGYVALGGIQLQITCLSREVLEEAYANPEQHKNLIVRVGGYSEYYYRLSDDLKRTIIERTIHLN